ncbi:CoA-binding protein [Sulfuricaulis sp.]
MVGLRPRPNRPSHRLASPIQRFGYRIIPVCPAVDSVLSEKSRASLREVPDKIDLVDMFRAPEYVGKIVEECLALKLPTIRLQDGVAHIPAASIARAGGMTVVTNRCVYRDYLDLFGPVPRS